MTSPSIVATLSKQRLDSVRSNYRGSHHGTVESEDVISLAERSVLQKVIRKSLVENRNDLEIQRKDPNCPLYSVKTFEELSLNPLLLKGVYALGFNSRDVNCQE